VPLKHRRPLLVSAAAALFVVFIVAPIFVAYLSTHPDDCNLPQTLHRPDMWGVSYENFTVTTRDGVKISGWLIHPANGGSPAVFIVMHSYMKCKASPELLQVVVGLARRGYYVVTFDFRGHGNSSGSTTLGPKETLDAEAVINWTYNRLPGKPIYLLGFGLGGVVAIVEGSADSRVKGVVADSPYINLRKASARWVAAYTPLPSIYAYLIILWWALLAHLPLDYSPMSVKTLDKPYIIVYGNRDPILEPNEARRLASLGRCCAGESCLVIVKGASRIETASVMGIESYLDVVESVTRAKCS
jgi:pimeloyl-ACP methyl ester carboxylesterase